MEITATQLIALLQEHVDPDAMIILEGCDCENACLGIETSASSWVKDGTVLLACSQSDNTIRPPD